MMKKSRLLLGLILLLTVVLLSSCQRNDRVVLNVYNWGDYLDESVIRDFEKKYNIKVNYDTFSTNEDMYVKLKAGGTDYDVVFPSDYIIERMINEDMLHKLDFDNIPNYKYIEDQFKNLEYDPQNEYSVPYFWGTVGIIYNKTMVDEPVTAGGSSGIQNMNKEILMMDSQRDSIGVALKMLGYDLNTRDLMNWKKPNRP